LGSFDEFGWRLIGAVVRRGSTCMMIGDAEAGIPSLVARTAMRGFG
jgi:hypothetical protein